VIEQAVFLKFLFKFIVSGDALKNAANYFQETNLRAALEVAITPLHVLPFNRTSAEPNCESDVQRSTLGALSQQVPFGVK